MTWTTGLSLAQKKKDARIKIEGQAKVLFNQVKEGKYLVRDDCEASKKGKVPLKARVNVRCIQSYTNLTVSPPIEPPLWYLLRIGMNLTC